MRFAEMISVFDPDFVPLLLFGRVGTGILPSFGILAISCKRYNIFRCKILLDICNFRDDKLSEMKEKAGKVMEEDVWAVEGDQMLECR